MNLAILDKCADAKNKFASFVLCSTGAFCTVQKVVSGKVAGEYRKPMRKPEALKLWGALVRDQYFKVTGNWSDAEALAERRISEIQTIH